MLERVSDERSEQRLRFTDRLGNRGCACQRPETRDRETDDRLFVRRVASSLKQPAISAALAAVDAFRNSRLAGDMSDVGASERPSVRGPLREFW